MCVWMCFRRRIEDGSATDLPNREASLTYQVCVCGCVFLKTSCHATQLCTCHERMCEACTVPC